MRRLVPILLWMACTPAEDSLKGVRTRPTAFTSIPTGGTPAGTPAGTPTPTEPLTLPLPTWELTGPTGQASSPRLVDLNGDGVLDVVTGHGDESGDLAGAGSVTAVDGATGALLWETPARQEVFATAAVVQLGGSAVPDLVLGGRHAELLAIDGESGAVLWDWPDEVAEARAAGWYNHYSAQVLQDLDGDSIAELLIANGGDSTLGPADPRPNGRLAILSGVDGAVLADAPTPDGAETYLSPILDGSGFFFGTGGETFPGGLWRAELSELLAGDLSGAALWVDGGAKGAIGPPSVADLDGDGVTDAVVVLYGGSVVAIDGATNQERWRVDLPGHESHSSAALGHFDDDGVPDVFASLPEGVFPGFTSATHLAIDGATGAVLWSEAIGVHASSCPLLVDLDGDGLDEAIFGVNQGALGPGMQWQPWRFDPVALEATPLSEPFARGSIAAPWIGDLDGDGLLELVAGTGDVAGAQTWGLQRYDLDADAPSRVSWGGYLGTDADGWFR